MVMAVGAVEFFADVFAGLGGVVILSASGNGESREAQSGHEPQQHYDNLAAHGQRLKCLHCKYNNNVHTRQGNRQESDGWGRKSYDAACSRSDVVKYMAILVYGPLFRALTSVLSVMVHLLHHLHPVSVAEQIL